MKISKTNNFKSFTTEVTMQLIEELKKGNCIWQQPWSMRNGCTNYVTKRSYSGFNQFYLGWKMQQKKYKHPLFMTYKQAIDAGGNVRKSEKGITVVFWKKLIKSNELSNDIETKQQIRLYPFLHTVFNIDQIDGIEFIIPTPDKLTHSIIEQCEKIITHMPTAPQILHQGNQAYYSPRLDIVCMPLPEQFVSPENYYQTTFHELIHSTGHPTRLNRFKEQEKTPRFGDEAYSKEELIAEIGATILSAKSGIKEQIIASSAAYIKGWLSALNNDHTLIFTAANHAEKAVNYICGQELVNNEQEASSANINH